MTDDQIIAAADKARHAGRNDEADLWIQLLMSRAKERFRVRKRDPDQQDRDEYIEENSLGGRIYKEHR